MNLKKRIIPFVLLVTLMFSVMFSTVAFASTGARTDPYSGYINRSLSSQTYSFYAPKNIELQLLEFIHGDEANNIVAEENMFNSTPASDEEWILLKYHIKYVSGPDEPLYADDIITSGDSFYTSNSTSINPISNACFSGDRTGMGEYDVNMYPGGESDVWYGLLVKKTVGYPLYRVGTGYNEADYTTKYSWFSTDPNYQETTNACIVTFESQGGSTVANMSASMNTTISAPENPTKAGFIFYGWYKDATCNTIWNFTSDKVTSDITLFAKWIAVKPSTPTAVKATSVSYNSIIVKWNADSRAKGYEVYRAASATGTYSLLATTTAANYTNTGLTSGKTYYYKVRAYSLDGTKKVYSGFSSIVSTKPVPSIPTSIKAARVTSKSIKVTWKAVAGATKYEVYRSLSKTGTYSLLTSTTALGYTNAKLTTGKLYYYKVRAYRLVGTAKIYSSFSSIVSTKP